MIMKRRFKPWKIENALDTVLAIFLWLVVIFGIISIIKGIFWGWN